MKVFSGFLQLLQTTCSFTHQIFFRKSFQSLKSNPGIKIARAIVIGALLPVSLSAQTNLGPYQEQPRHLNPLREPFNFYIHPTPVAVDLDKDNDFDLVVSVYAESYTGQGFRYLKNIGSATQPVFSEVLGGNPFRNLGLSIAPAPSFSDLDKDGDFDMLVGFEDGSVSYYKNNGGSYPYVKQSGDWDPVTKSGNLFNGVDFGSYATPVFVDLDKDGDDDVMIGSSAADPLYKSSIYYKNNGDGTFTETEILGLEAYDATAPAFADIDKDNDLDAFIGNSQGFIYYYKQTSAGVFEIQSGSANPFDGVDKGSYTAPTLADFDKDADIDMIVGFNGAKVDYYENKGNGTFELRSGLESPLGGVSTSGYAHPVFDDFDNNGTIDLIIGAEYSMNGQAVLFFKNINGNYTEVKAADNPFAALPIKPYFTPCYIDLNGDGKKDLVGSVYNAIQYFKNENGSYVEQTGAANPFTSVTVSYNRADFADIDGDLDYDLFISDYDNTNDIASMRYFENTGSPTAPAFTERTGTANLLNGIAEEYELFPRLVDIDHDGDLDAVIGEGGGVHIEIQESNELMYFENTGSRTQPTFTYKGNVIPQYDNAEYPAPYFVDYDKDGDLDIFEGDQAGYISYFKNNNPVPVTSVNANPLNAAEGSAIILDPSLLISDADNDSLVQAVISITDFEPGKDELTFVPQTDITGNFNQTSGVLTFRGRASITRYQTLLRGVSYKRSTGASGGRKKINGRTKDVVKTITISVFDADFTTPAPVSKSINVDTNSPPVITPAPLTYAGANITLNLLDITTDPDNNLNINSFVIVSQPVSGASGTLNFTSITDVSLVLDYTGITFSGTDQLVIRACDDAGACTENTITIDVAVAAESKVIIYNAVAPNSNSNNQYMRILNLSAGHKVSIYNRWGDEVFSTENYFNESSQSGERFKGLNNNGKQLPSGTYFYKIEFTDGAKTLTGYLALKQ